MANAYDTEREDDEDRGYTPDDQSNIPGPGDLPEGPDPQNFYNQNPPFIPPFLTPPPIGPFGPPRLFAYAGGQPPPPPPPARPAPAPPPATAPAARPGAAVAPRPAPPPAPRPGPFGMPPFQRAQRQLYVPPFPNRPPHLWGRPPEYGMMPEPWQVPMIFQGLAGQLGMWGSGSPTMPGSVQYLAGNMGMFSGAFMKGYLQGQQAIASLKYQQLKQTAAELEIQQGRQLNEYGDIFAEYQDGRDPQGFMQALFEKANDLHDQPMLRALDLGPDAVMDLQRYRDSKYQTTHAANSSLRKEEKKAGAWPSSATEPGAPGMATPGGTGAPGLGTPGGRTAAEGLPPTGQRTLDQFGRPLPQPPVRAQAAPDASELTDPGEEALAHADMRGEHWTTSGMDPGALNRVLHRSALLRSGQDKALNEGTTPEERLAGLAKVDPALADEVKGVLDYSERVGYGREGMPPRIAQLAHRVDPNWSQSVYQFVTEFRNPNSSTGKTMQRSNAMAAAAEEVLKSVQALRKKGVSLDELSPVQSIEAFLSRRVKGDPEWSNLFSAYNAYIQEMVAVTRGGTGAEGDIIRALQNTPINNLRQVLGALRVDANTAFARVEGNKRLWDQQTRGGQGEAPGYDPHVVSIMHGITTLDDSTGKFSEHAPQELKDLEFEGAGPPEVQQRKKEQDQRATDLSAEDKQAYDWARANPNDPRAQKILKALGF